MAKEESIGRKARSGIIWTIIRTLGSQGARFISSIVLARLLFPEDFGIMSIVLIVTRFAEKLGSFGFAQVLVQKNLVDEKHIRTTFTLNLIISGIITGTIFIFAPLIAPLVTNSGDTQYIPEVKNILQFISFIFIIQAFYAIPSSLLRRDMRFKEVSMLDMLGNIIKFMSPIIFALLGFGVWSLVIGMVLGELVHMFAFYFVIRWVPRIGLYKEAFQNVFSFGVWMNLYSYIQYFYKNLDYLLISKFLGYGVLGYYERAYNLMNTPRKRVSDMINAVLFSAYSRIQDQEKRLILAMRKVMSGTTLITFPIMIWLFFAAPSFISFIYGERWLETIKPLQIMCISGLIESITMVFYPAFLAKGLVKNRTKAHTIVLIFLAILVYFAAQESIIWVSWAIAAASVFGLFINANEYRRFSEWTWKDLFASIRPATLTGAITTKLISTLNIRS